MKCATKNCRGRITKTGRSHFCSKCRSRRWRDKFPLHYSFKNLRVRAIQRGKEFTLTRDEYISFAIKTDYAKMKGKTSLSLSIDRKNNDLGYTKDNIQAIALRENSRKQFTDMPDWMKAELKQAEAGIVPESHRHLIEA
jgi:hypothetical protein